MLTDHQDERSKPAPTQAPRYVEPYQPVSPWWDLLGLLVAVVIVLGVAVALASLLP